jgi:hypothetical protein
MKDLVYGSSQSIPQDLQIIEQPQTDKNFYNFKAAGLKLDTKYTVKFQWVYEDGTVSDWSPGKDFTSINLPTLTPPKFLATDLTYFNGILNITWNGLDASGQPYTKAFDRINVYVKDETLIGSPYRLVGSLKAAGTIKVPVPPVAHSVKLTVVSLTGVESDFSTAQLETPKLTPNTPPSGVSASWQGTNFRVAFTHNPAEEYFSYYKVKLTAGGTSKVVELSPTPGTSSQAFTLSLSQNRAMFGVPQTSISGTVRTVNIYGNEGSEISFSSTAYSNTLPAATIVATAISNGYSVSYTTPNDATFDKIEIEEVESSASTAPSTGYTKVFSGSSNPAITITPNTNKRWIRARFVDNIGLYGSYGTAVSVTPTNPVVADTEGPADVSSVTTSGGLDNTGTVGFNGYADISWPAVSGGGIRGYRIRFRPVTTPASSYSYADSPGTGTSYRLAGLGAGLTYEIAVATYDEYNNTSSNYVAGSNVNVGGTPYIASTVDVTGYFKAKANPSDADSTAFKFGYGVDTGKRGLVFNANNYWYIDSNQTATLKVGGATTNYIEWNGSSFVIDGDLRAKKGSFSGNINMASGASIYSGTIGGNTVTATGDTGGSLVGAGYILNSSGLTFSSASVSGITTIDASTGLFTTASANIGGWNVNSSTINKTSNSGTVTLDSSNAQIRLSSSSYTAGLATPNTNSATDIVFWAGGARDTNANFYVRADGTTVMKSAIITGYASSNDINGLAKTDMSNVTSIDGAKITTGIIKSANHSGPTDGSNFTTSGTAINLSNGTVSSPKFRIDTTGAAFFTGTLSAGTSLSSPSITGGSITGASLTVTGAITAGVLQAYADGTYQEGTELNDNGSNESISPGSSSPTITIANGKIESNGLLQISSPGSSYTEIIAGGTQSAMFSQTKASLVFQDGLYLGDPNKSYQSAFQSTGSSGPNGPRVPWITIDASLRLRRGAPLTYPGGTAGAYVRNIYIKQSTATSISSTTGYIGDIFITY